MPADKFRANMTQMVRVAKEAGIVAVLLTAPSSHQIGKEPSYLAERFLHDLSQLVPLHQQYVSIVREVAAQEEAPLCDLARRFEALPPAEVKDTYFKADGIHATPAGGEKIAQFLAECFQEDPRLSSLWR